MRKLLATTAAAVLMANVAYAESHATAEAETETEVEAEAEEMANEAETTMENVEAETEEMAEDADAAAENVEAEATEMAEEAETEMDTSVFADVNTGIENLTAEQLIGMDVHGMNDEDVGEIGDLVIGDDGSLSEVIIDVGGFLGLGEKPVAVAFEDLEFTDTEGVWTVRVNATEEELNEMPAWEG